MKEIKREFTIELEKRLQEPLNFIQVVLGPRQVGKTTGLEQIIKKWKGPSLMITADETAAPSAEWLRLQWQRAKELSDETLFVVDEVQKIPDWSTTVKNLFDSVRRERRMQMVLLGSASLSLQHGLAESLAGRYEIIPANHWNLSECHQAFGWGIEEFLKFGGYPAASELVEDVSRWQSFMKNAVIEPVLIKDILGITSISKPALFRQTFELAMSYPAQEISYQKLLGQLQESGNATTIKHYLELLEGAYLIKALQKYSGSEIRKKGSSPKILPLNTALIHAYKNPENAMRDPEWRGRVFEAAIGASLARSEGDLFYWRDGRLEVDYVLKLEEQLFCIEVKSGRRKSRKGLEKFIERYPGSIPLLIDHQKGEKLLGLQTIKADMLRSMI